MMIRNLLEKLDYYTDEAEKFTRFDSSGVRHGCRFWVDSAELYRTCSKAASRIRELEKCIEGPERGIKDKIPWNWIDNIFKWAARDENDLIWVFENKPVISREDGVWLPRSGEHDLLEAHLKKFSIGYCHWTESLQRRPDE